MNEIHKDRNNSIDFIKGVAILSVIILHNTPANKLFQIAWIGQAVPLFLLVTAYLTCGSFQNGKTMTVYYSKQSTGKMLKRIFVPFIFVQCVIYFFPSINFSLYSILLQGGIGPGSYYPWLYLQCWIILPFIIKIIDNMSVGKSSLLFLSICIILEIASSIIHINAQLYRLLFYRYLFLLYLGCLLKKQEWKINVKILTAALIGLIFSLFEIYININLEPFFINQWQGVHWITAFYAVLIFLTLRHIYTYTHICIRKTFLLLGKYSYEIFLCQMFVFSIFPKKLLGFIENLYLETILFIIFTTIFSIAPIILYKKRLKKILVDIFQ
jgi:peptidoglycan/LPS O-acetylase OafA/YrhL